MKTDTSAALNEARRQMQEYQQQNTQQQQQLQQEIAQLRRQAAPPPNPNRYDSERFYKNLNDAPPDAVVDALAYKMGMTSDELLTSFKNMNHDVSNMKQQMLSAQFLQRHSNDFDPKYAGVLTEKFASLIDSGHPQDIRTIESAYRELQEEGKVKPLSPKQEQKQEEPNPALSGNGDISLPVEEETKLMNMPMDELEKVMREKGVLR
jgi:hypothetical protein